MNKLFKPASIGFSILLTLVFFMLGLYFAKMVGAGKNQMLAGGAIVFFYGLVSAGIALVASFFITYMVATRKIVIFNWILFVLLLITVGITYFNFKQLQRGDEEPLENSPKEVTEPAATSANLIWKIKDGLDPDEVIVESRMGMGVFSPNHYENSTLYFYGNPNLEKSLLEHIPFDSLTFKRNQYNQFEIATAPPWFVPFHFKLDYDMAYFKVISVAEELVEVIVNETDGRTAYIDRKAGNLMYWPDFFMRVHSVEFPSGSTEKVRNRDFENSGENNVPHSFMRPLKVKEDWMYVLLIGDEFKTVGKGWIRWKRDGKLLITYNLLS